MLDQVLQARRKDVPGQAQVALELAKAANTIERVTNDQQRPTITEAGTFDHGAALRQKM